MDIKEELFKGVSFSDLMSNVYHNSKKKDRQINQLISQLQPLIKNASDATIIVPLIKEYMEISVKNDDQLIKMAAIVQRLSTGNANTGDGGLLTEEEMAQLQEITEEIAKTVEEPKQIEAPDQNGNS